MFCVVLLKSAFFLTFHVFGFFFFFFLTFFCGGGGGGGAEWEGGEGGNSFNQRGIISSGGCPGSGRSA